MPRQVPRCKGQHCDAGLSRVQAFWAVSSGEGRQETVRRIVVINSTGAHKKRGCIEKHPGFLASGLRYKALRQPVDRVALAVADDMAVDPESDTDIAMSELITNNCDWSSAFD
jgi:hypothetical protein